MTQPEELIKELEYCLVGTADNPRPEEIQELRSTTKRVIAYLKTLKG